MDSMYNQLLEEDPYRKYMMNNYGSQAVDSAKSSLSLPNIGQSAQSSYESPAIDLGGAKMAQSVQPQSKSTGQSLAEAGITGATTGVSTMNPYLAAAAVGGSLLSSAMANEAQAKQNQRQRAMQIAQEQGQGEQRAFQMLMEAYRGALR